MYQTLKKRKSIVRHLIFVFVVFAAGTLLTGGATAASPSKGSTLPEILPPGKGLTLLLENCSSCHSVVCAVKGQRPVDRWESLKNDHKDKVTGLSDGDLNTLFSYLAENFNNNKPEPNLPPELAQQGSCTPF
jgi:mono/diheme cytochrome c family protein